MVSMTLFVSNMSTPSRAVTLLVRNLGLDIDIKQVNLLAGEHRRSEFSRINPRCCVPTLIDNDGHHEFILWESKAIMIYLAEKCSRYGHSLYPKCIKTRAIIHQRLFHDASELYVRILDIANLAFSGVNSTITTQHKENLRRALQILEHFGFDISQFTHINDWYKRMSKCEGFKECENGAQEFGIMVKGKLSNSFKDI